MDKQTLSNYGWVVVVVLVLAVMLGLATPFGKYVGMGFSNIAKAYKEVSNADAIDSNIDTMRDEWNEFLGNTENTSNNRIPQYGINDPELNHNGTIPKGGVYYINGFCGMSCYAPVSDNGSCGCGNIQNATILREGDKFPSNVSYDNINMVGDCYVYGDYTYIAEGIYFGTQGWWVKYTNETKEYYDKYLETIAGSDVVSIQYTFSNNSSLKEIPEISPKIKKMYGAFYNTTNATFKNNSYIIPTNVTDIGDAFNNCKNITGTIKIQMTTCSNASACFSGTVKPITIINNSTLPHDFFLFLQSSATNNNVSIG